MNIPALIFPNGVVLTSHSDDSFEMPCLYRAARALGWTGGIEGRIEGLKTISDAVIAIVRITDSPNIGLRFEQSRIVCVEDITELHRKKK